MATRRDAPGALDDIRVPTKLKLSALWASTMFCYVYGDYFGLYQPAQLRGMLAGRIEPLGPATQGVLLGVSVMMAIPSLMVFLSIALKAPASRWTNIVVGSAFTVIVLLTMPGTWLFYLFLSSVEVVLTLLIVWEAWRWPRRASIDQDAARQLQPG
jgi:hypothetical protein